MKRTISMVVLLCVAAAVLMGAGPASGQSLSGQRPIIDLGTYGNAYDPRRAGSKRRYPSGPGSCSWW